MNQPPVPAGTVLRPAGPPLEVDVAGIVVHDERLRSVLRPDSRLLSLFDGARWSEGPAWCGQAGGLVWSDIERRQLLRWHASADELGMVTVLAAQTEYINGNAVDHDNRLVHCEHGRRCISRTEANGATVVLADTYGGCRLNSPNDVVVAADNAIWFSDPTFGITNPDQGYPATPELDHRSVYRLDPNSAELQRMADLEQPNGLAFSPDERVLYVSDTSRDAKTGDYHDIFAFDVEPGPQLGERRHFAAIEPGVPDGFAVDGRGWLWTSSGDGVQILTGDGEPLGKIPTPGVCANVTFGSTPLGNRVFITAAENLYAVDLAG